MSIRHRIPEDLIARLIESDKSFAMLHCDREGTILGGKESLAAMIDADEAILSAVTRLQDLHPDLSLAGFDDVGASRQLTTTVRITGAAAHSVHLRITALGDDGIAAVYRSEQESATLRQEIRELRESIGLDWEQTQKETEFLRQMLHHTMETIQLGIVLQETNSGLIAYANEGFVKITGLPTEKVQGHYFNDILKNFPEANQRLINYTKYIWECLQRSEKTPPPAHWEVEFPAGRKTIETYGQPIIVEGHPWPYIMLIIEDHTDRQRLQVQLVQSEKLAAIGQLAAGIAHEMRNPLTTIYNALYDLTEIISDPTPDVAEDINIAMEEIKRTQEIINNLLDFAREAERSGGRSNLNDVLQRTIRLVQHDLSNKRIELSWSLGEIEEVAINNNALKQIIINLITNAAQAMAEGGILSIHTVQRPGPVPARANVFDDVQPGVTTYHAGSSGENPRPDFDIPSSMHHVVLEVSDTGTGIPDSIVRNIFNPFFTTKPPGSGTGLGLSVVHSLIQDAGGAISVQTQVGVGTTFIISLPVATLQSFL